MRSNVPNAKPKKKDPRQSARAIARKARRNNRTAKKPSR